MLRSMNQNEEKKYRSIAKDVGVIIVGTIIALMFFNYVLNPLITGRPDIEIITLHPYNFPGDDTITFNVTIENTGSKSVADLRLVAIAKDPITSEYFSGVDSIFSETILQSGEIAYSVFDLQTPNTNKLDEFVMAIRVSSHTIGSGYYWEYEITYQGYPDSNLYSYQSMNKVES